MASRSHRRTGRLNLEQRWWPSSNSSSLQLYSYLHNCHHNIHYQVFTITNSFPAHPAGSFHYPALSRLPRLAVYSLSKVVMKTMIKTRIMVVMLMMMIHTLAVYSLTKVKLFFAKNIRHPPGRSSLFHSHPHLIPFILSS